MSVETFRREIELQLERLQARSSNYRMARDFGLITEHEPKVRFYFEQANEAYPDKLIPGDEEKEG